jgi:DNA-directed RNA polymerase subunit RPC12/RpoP
MSVHPTTPDTVERCVACHAEGTHEVKTYECSRCGGVHNADEVEGPPYRCPDCNVFMALGSEVVCSDCQGEGYETEWAQLWRCDDCDTLLDAEDEDHVCTPAEHAAVKAADQARTRASLERYRAEKWAEQPPSIHTAEVLRALGFTVRLENLVGPPPDYESLPDAWYGAQRGDDTDFTICAGGGTAFAATSGDRGEPFMRLVGLVANKLGVTE